MAYLYPDAVIQVFCKAPIAGQVKTRLMPELSATEALAVHQLLTKRTLDLVCGHSLCPVQLWCSPSVDHPFFIEASRHYALELNEQCSGDLGQRMLHAMTEACKNFQAALLIGCDCPSFSLKDFTSAIAAIRGEHDCVLAPTEDGGYSLIALKRPWAELFTDLPWGGSTVLAETRLRIERLQLRYYPLAMQWDVDVYADYLRLLPLLH